MGEAKRRAKQAIVKRMEPMIVDTPGGRIHVQWDTESSATPNGQLTFFAEFLHTSGIYDAWVRDCPLHYNSPNAPTKYDVLGTLLLSILAGHNRYAHITALRYDGVSPDILKMKKIISEDAMRRGFGRIESASGEAWLKSHLLCSVATALNTLFGKQQGAEVGYNPHKQGRSSHALHTYWVANLRLVLDVVVSSGKQSNSPYTQQGLSALLDSLDPSQYPALVRGDCGFGNDPFIVELESRHRRLRERPRRVEEPMGMGLLHDTEYRTLPDVGAVGCVDLQLVELVLPCRQAGGAHGGDHQSSVIASRRWSRRKTRWTDDLIFERHACRRATPDMEGLQIFCTIRSYLATLHKQGENIFDVLIQAFHGCVTSPRFA